MKKTLPCAIVLALLAWFLWPLTDVEPIPPGVGAALNPSTPAPVTTDPPESRPADAAPEHVRQPVDRRLRI